MADAVEPVAKKRAPTRREQPAPDQYELTKSHVRWLEQQGAINVDAVYETEKFLDHHRAKGSTFKDWDAAWRNWMRRAMEWNTFRSANARRAGLDRITPQAVLSLFEEE